MLVTKLKELLETTPMRNPNARSKIEAQEGIELHDIWYGLAAKALDIS